MKQSLSELQQQYAARAEQWQQQAKALSLAELVAVWAQTTPDAPALEHDETVLSYAQLDDEVTRISRVLRARLGADVQRVALSVTPGIRQVVTLLAIQRCGAAYIPIDPKYPDARIGQILADAQPQAWITAEQLGQRFATAVPLQLTATELWRMAAAPAFVQTQPQTTAYIMYTSGTTGRPKGVVISHSNIASYLAGAQQCYGITAQDRILQFCSVSFDTFVEELGLTLLNGACLVIRPDDILAGSHRFWQTIQALQITAVSVPTAYWHVLCDQLAQADLRDCPLRLCIIGGESYDRKRLQTWFDYMPPDVALFNSYGPTETTVVITVGRLTAEALEHNLVGRPLASGMLVLVDSELQPLQDGPGEVLVTGPAVSRGYYANPEQTVQKFVQLPDWPDGPLFYRTGDRAQFQQDGSLQYLGRIDNQVKLRGYRIELNEIEIHLAAYPGMQDVAVVKAADSEALVAHYSARTAVAGSLLRQALLQQLPEFMVPAHFIYHSALPVNTHGKIDRLVLSQWPLAQESVLTAAPVAGTSWPALRDILQQVLQRDDLQPGDLYERTGISEPQLQLITQRVRQDLQIELTAELLSAQPTLQQMSLCLDGMALLQQLWARPDTDATYQVLV